MSDDETENGDAKRKKRGEALRGRLSQSSKTPETSEASETTEAAETSKTTETPDSSEPSQASKTSNTTEPSETATRDRKNVNMYLPEELIDDAALAFDELNLDLRRQGAEPFEKNRHFRALVLALGIDAVREMNVDEARTALTEDDRLDDPPSGE